MEEQDSYIQALITLHKGLDRQGPGDAGFSEHVLDQLSGLPSLPRIADIGCGAGAGTLLLAKRFGSKVRAVDFSQEFLDQMMYQARLDGLEDLIEPVACDMGSLDWEAGSIDLLWSEGAAYIITFEGALQAWRPLMAKNGIVVISEMNYFSDDVPKAAVQYMADMYPGIKSEDENIRLINTSGFEALAIHRLPTQAWWDNYYGPLQENMLAFNQSSDPVMQAVLKDTKQEMEFFSKYSDAYGYSFYIMRAV